MEKKFQTVININSLSSETKNYILRRSEQHRKHIDKIIVPQYIEDNYAVTYRTLDNTILGWPINVEKNGQQHPDVYFEPDKFYNEESFVLYKKTLLFCYGDDRYYRYCKYLF